MHWSYCSLALNHLCIHTADTIRILHVYHDDVIKWKHILRYWPFVRGIHRSPVNPPHKGQWRRALMFPLICTWINNWENNSEAGDLRRHRAHYDVSVMMMWSARYPKGMSAATVLTATVLTAGQHRPLTSREMCGSLYCIFLLSSTYNRNTAWLRNTVKQKSLGKSAAAGQTAGPPRLLTSRGTSAWPYRITAQYSFYPVQLYN